MAQRVEGLLVLLLAALCNSVPHPPAPHPHHLHHHQHVAGGKCSQCPHHSDVIATSRFQHNTPTHGPYDTWTAMEAFHATRMDWVYTTNATFVAEAHRRGLELTVAINPQTADGPGKTSHEVGRVLNIHGEPLVAPWMRGWSKPWSNYGCINNPDFLKIQYAFASSLLETGTGGIQHDDPGANGEAVTWNEGDPVLSGCYCEHCMSGFTAALMSGALSEPERAQYNISDAFNYRQLLLQQPWNSSSKLVQVLRPLFVTYQQNVTEKYITGLKEHMDAKAAELGRSTSLSCNNGGEWQTPYFLCDYGLGELSIGSTTPAGLEAVFTTSPPAGKMQVMTMPKTSNVSLTQSPAFTTLVRTAIAFAYSLGGHMMAPWDIYMPGTHAPR